MNLPPREVQDDSKFVRVFGYRGEDDDFMGDNDDTGGGPAQGQFVQHGRGLPQPGSTDAGSASDAKGTSPSTVGGGTDHGQNAQ